MSIPSNFPHLIGLKSGTSLIHTTARERKQPTLCRDCNLAHEVPPKKKIYISCSLRIASRPNQEHFTRNGRGEEKKKDLKVQVNSTVALTPEDLDRDHVPSRIILLPSREA